MPIKADINLNSSDNDMSRNSTILNINNTNNSTTSLSKKSVKSVGGGGVQTASGGTANDKLARIEGGEQQITVSFKF